MQTAIENIIFDLGGVLLNVDYDAPVRAFKQLGVNGFEAMYAKAAQSDLFDKFETGQLSPGAFRQTVREHSGLDLTDADIDAAWNSILLDFPPARIALLYELKAKYRIFLLSNTNNIHITAFEDTLRQTFGKNVFDEVFEAYYYSSELGLRKPHAATFNAIAGRHKLVPGQTLFIDDSPQHVEGARAAGLKAEWLDVKTEDVVGLCRRLKLI